MNALTQLLRRDPTLLAGRYGRWRWYWAIIGTVATVAMIYVLMHAAQMVLQLGWPHLADGLDLSDDSKLLVPGKPATYAVLVVLFLPLAIAPILGFRLVHQKRWGDWPFQPESGPGSWLIFTKCGAAFLIVALASYTVVYVLSPDRFSMIPRGLDHAPWFLLALLIVLMQAFSEEAVFKGYLYRIWGAVIPYRWPIVLMISALFTALHWQNSDFARDRTMAVIVFVIGSIISFALYFRTGTLAAPTGLHWANNIFAMLFLVTTPSEFDQSSFATYADPVLAAGRSNLTDPEAWIGLTIGNLAYIALLFHPRSPLYIAKIESVVPPMPNQAQPETPPPVAGTADLPPPTV